MHTQSESYDLSERKVVNQEKDRLHARGIGHDIWRRTVVRYNSNRSVLSHLARVRTHHLHTESCTCVLHRS
ncbi:hypothetical protein IC620_09610 [Hazenella sp. IB182357]|uniref:Uncharacterized protein n=1 Tax=Polycladospora coralii TaxID=2771432 RepID=A0A926NBD1_9BACL|nr:hypothetical protein [Polycladospora coralii]MBD1372610.1 hypothetical protein [Polycladospora coralii]MBS7531283.1 hypothetical protein [Polycladospora coralii]